MSTDMVAPDEVLDERTRKLIWKRLGSRSVREIAEETGLTPEQVFAAKRALFEEIDVLSIDEQVTKALVSMQELADSALDKSASVGDERNYSGIINSAVNAQEKILKQLRAMRKEDNSKITELNEMRVRELLRLIDATVISAVEEIAEDHGVEREDLMEVFQRHLSQEARSMDIQRA